MPDTARSPVRRPIESFVTLFIVSLAFLLAPNLTRAQDKVVLQLIWEHQFQFAGFYAADWQGYYRDAGIEVEVRTAVTPEGKIIQGLPEVAQRRADFTIGGANILVRRDKGDDLVVLAVLFQRSPIAFYARRETGLGSPGDLYRLRVARSVDGLTDVELQSMLRLEGLDPDALTSYPHEPGLRHLMERRVDVTPGYTLATPWQAGNLAWTWSVSTRRPMASTFTATRW